MPKKSLRQQLADARRENQALRDAMADQGNHQGAREFAEGKVRRLEAELTTTRHKVQEMERAEQARLARRPLSDAELLGLAATVLTEAGPRTEAQTTLTHELERRGIVAPHNPWKAVLERMGRRSYFVPTAAVASAAVAMAADDAGVK